MNAIQNVLFVSLSVHLWYGRYTAKGAETVLEGKPIDKELVTDPHWRLLPKDWRKRIQKVSNSMRRALAKVSLPMPLRGIDAVPLAKAEDLFNQLDALETEFGQVADELVANWDSLCEGLKDKLSPKQWTAAERLLSQGPQAIRQPPLAAA
jgi:hypothetical protein